MSDEQTAAELISLDDYIVACCAEDPTFVLHLRAAQWEEEKRAIAAAVAAEREACAQTAAAYRPANMRPEHRWVLADAITSIAAAIRNRGEAT